MQEAAMGLLMNFDRMDVSTALLQIHQGKILGHDNEFASIGTCCSQTCQRKHVDSLESDTGPVCIGCRQCYCEQCFPADKPFCSCTQEDIIAAIMRLHLLEWFPAVDSTWT